MTESRLPALLPASATPDQPHTDPMVQPIPGQQHSYTVLVVDDQVINRELLGRHLRLLGYAHVQARDGVEALEIIRSRPVDLVLLDLMMPRMNGYETLEQIRNDPQIADTAVIVITAVQDDASAARCIELGAVDYLSKPFNSTLLRARINNCRDRQHYARAAQAHLQELMALQQFDSELAASITVEQVADIVISWVFRRTNAQAALLANINDGQLTVLATHGYPPGSVAVGDHLSRTEDQGADGKDGGLRIADGRWLTSVFRRPTSVFGHTHTTLLSHSDQPCAVLVTEHAGDAEPPAHEQHCLGRLANRAALALAKAQLYAAVQQANNAKSEFMAVLAHELKTPLTVIKGYVQLLREGALHGADPDRFYDVIATNANTMRTLISELDDISRIEAGQIVLHDHLVVFDALLKTVIHSLQPQITAKAQTCTVHSAPTLPAIRGDAGRIAQILTNLLSNACKYTPDHGTITVHLTHVEEMVRCSVRDTGIGIHPDDQPQIFGRFSRAKDAAARSQSGTGLGLYITKRLVELHGGRIWFESEFRAGTVFITEFPITHGIDSNPM